MSGADIRPLVVEMVKEEAHELPWGRFPLDPTVKPAQAAERAATDLHAQIMRLPANVPQHVQARTHSHWATWREGFRDARQAAAELARAAVAALPAAPAEPKPVAWVTDESLRALKRGGNGSRGTVPMHHQRSSVAKHPLYLAPAQDPENDPPAREASDWTPPAGYDGDGSVTAMAARVAAPAPAARVDAPSEWVSRPTAAGRWLWAEGGDRKPVELVLDAGGTMVAYCAEDEPEGTPQFYWEGTETTQELMPGQWKRIEATAPAAAAVPVPLTADQVDAAAKTLAECFDYPWEYMPAEGRIKMCQHARRVIAAAGITQQPGGER